MEEDIVHLEPRELILARQLINEGKFDEALQSMKKFEETGEHTLNELVSSHLLKCDIFSQRFLINELFELAEQTYKESLGLGKSLLSVDALYYMTLPLIMAGNLKNAEETIKLGEKLLKSITHKPLKNYKQREASIAFLKGMFYNPIVAGVGGKGDPDLALEYFKQCLTLREKYGEKHEIAMNLLLIGWILLLNKGEIDHAFEYVEHALNLAKECNIKFTIAWCLSSKAVYYYFKGNLERCISLNEQSLALFKELNNSYFMMFIFNNMSDAYRMKGELDHAIKCSEQSLALTEEMGISPLATIPYDFLIQMLIEKGDFERAQESLDQMEQIITKLNDRELELTFLLDKALLLKSSTRVRDRGKAEEILKQVLGESLLFESKIRSLLHLSELLLGELRTTGDLEVVNELNSYIDQLLNITEKTHSYWILGETYLLQAKLALIKLDLKRARRLLSKGQKIAEAYGLSLLAMKISNEHDELLKNLDMWEDLKKSETSLTKRMELSRLNQQMGLMVRRRALEVPETSDEDPILLLVVSEGGVPLFSQSFVKDRSFEEHLFGGFLSAINSFIDEMFSEGLDRVSFGEHTLLMRSVPPFFMCYVFKGQSYYAHLRVGVFIEKIKSDKDIWHSFKKHYQVNQELQLKDIPSLEPLINEIFIRKTLQLINY
jgi:tetratricopeptide (TPR) repeat protein